MIAKFKQLTQHQGFMKYFKNTSWLFGEKILRMIVGLFVGIWIARYLGPEQFGLYSYAQSFVGLFTAIAALGLDSIVVRNLVKDKNKRDLLIGTAFWLKVFGAFLVLLILAIAINLTSNDTYTNTLIFIIASATIFQSFNVVDFYFQSKVMSKFVVYANIISLFISSIVKITLIINEASLIAFAWVILFDSIILAIGFSYFFFKHTTFKVQNLKFNKATAIDLLRDSWPLILSAFVVSLYIKIDQIMIKEILDSKAVGHYAAAVRLSEAWYFIPVIISSSLFPAIVNAKKQNKKLYYARLQRLYNLMVWIAVAIALPMTFLSDWLIELLYGGKYQESGTVLMIHIWAGIFIFLGVASGKWFINENLQILAFWRTFYGMLINIALNILLIPRYGIEGAAIATISASIVAGFLFDFFHIQTRKVFYMKLQSLLFSTIRGKNVY